VLPSKTLGRLIAANYLSQSVWMKVAQPRRSKNYMDRIWKREQEKDGRPMTSGSHHGQPRVLGYGYFGSVVRGPSFGEWPKIQQLTIFLVSLSCECASLKGKRMDSMVELCGIDVFALPAATWQGEGGSSFLWSHIPAGTGLGTRNRIATNPAIACDLFSRSP
jgi:hypothetical protein